MLRWYDYVGISLVVVALFMIAVGMMFEVNAAIGFGAVLLAALGLGVVMMFGGMHP
jgi:hypothetical protein